MLGKMFQSICAKNFKIQMHKEKARDMGGVCSALCLSLGSLDLSEISSLKIHPSFFFITCLHYFFREKKKRAVVLQSCILFVGGCFPRLLVTVEEEMTTF